MGNSRTSGDVESKQRKQYDQIAAEYSAHYDDVPSSRYREIFFYDPVFKGVPLQGKRVLDGMCGTGGCTEYLLGHGAQVTGLDISAVSLARYKTRFPTAKTIEASILETGLETASFDVAVIIGGLHHVQPHVGRALNEIHRILKPGGYFLFIEPPAGTITDLVRKAWYRLDKYFEDNEAAIDVKGLLRAHNTQFESLSVRYGGGPAYFLVYNSLVLRVPFWLKNRVSASLMALDRFVESLFFPKILASYVAVQLRSKTAAMDDQWKSKTF